MDDIFSSGPATVKSSLTMGVLSSIALALRIWAKSTTKAGFTADDYWILFSLATYWTYAGVMMWGIFGGGGGLNMINFRTKNIEGITIYLKTVTINSCLFVTSATAIKISILFFYRRIFLIYSRFNCITIIIGVICVCWWATYILGLTLFCIPLESIWHTWVHGRCINFGVFFLVVSIVDVLIEFSLLALPLLIIPKLQLQRKLKWLLGGISLLGGFVCVTAIVRIPVIYKPGSSQVNLTRGAIPVWSNIHLGTAMICACLPMYRPLLTKKWFKKSQLNESASGDAGAANQSPYDGIRYRDRTPYVESEVIGGTKSGEWAQPDWRIPPNAIAVKSTTSIV